MLLEWLGRLDFWLTLITLGAGLYFLGWKDFLQPRLLPLWRVVAGVVGPWLRSTRTQAFAPASSDVPRSSADVQAVQAVQAVQVGPRDVVLNADDCAMVARMILHNRSAVKQSKTETVYAGCGKHRGGSKEYRRCAELYDLFFLPADVVRFPNLMAEREAVRNGS